MRIGFNGLFLKNRSVGIGRYTYEVLRHLKPGDFSIKLYVQHEQHATGLSQSLGRSLEVEVVEPSPFLSNEFLRVCLCEFEMFRRAKNEGFDVFHSPYFVCSPFKLKREIVTIHDVIHMRYPEYVTSWPRALYWWYNKRRAVKLTHVVTDSKCSKDDIVAYLKVNNESVSVIYPGVSERFRPLNDPAAKERIRLKYSLPEKFILYVGGYDRRKNVEKLIECFKHLVLSEPLWTHNLILAGKNPDPIPELVSDFPKLIERQGLASRVWFTGYIDEGDLPQVYNMADIFVYPSLYEGFGLPVLEAMACGTPTIASNASSIPEILNRSDLLFRPEDREEIYNRIARLLSNPDTRQVISLWGVERAKVFSWSETSKALLKNYSSVFGKEA